jgi:hypothetical protein
MTAERVLGRMGTGPPAGATAADDPVEGEDGQEADNGLVPPILELLAGAIGQELAQVVLAEDRNGLFGDLGRHHPGHGGVVVSPSSRR